MLLPAYLALSKTTQILCVTRETKIPNNNMCKLSCPNRDPDSETPRDLYDGNSHLVKIRLYKRTGVSVKLSFAVLLLHIIYYLRFIVKMKSVLVFVAVALALASALPVLVKDEEGQQYILTSVESRQKR